ncbi:MAG: NAD(P)/FAD-dependent oxidoreductase [Microthrixaceae bacterium]
MLYQVATAGLDGDDICFPVRGIFASQRNVRVRMGTVVEVDVDQRTVELRDGSRLPYDDLVLAAGAVTNTYGIEGVEEHAFGLKSLADAQALRSHVLLCFERADAAAEHRMDGTMTMVVVGGGPTGVEMAGGLMELVSHVLGRDHPGLDMRTARVVLVEAGDRLLPGLHEELSNKARRILSEMGVEVMLGQAVQSASADAVVVQEPDGTTLRIPTRTIVWTAGVTANPLARSLGVELAAGSRIVVGPDLAVPGHPELHVIGDMAATRDREGNLLPQVAPVAVQGGRYVAARITGKLLSAGPSAPEGGPRSDGEPFSYVDRGSMATIGRRAAVAQLPGRIHLTGALGWFAWLLLHLVMLLGFRNRANVLVNWAWNYLTYDRASRVITEPPPHT